MKDIQTKCVECGEILFNDEIVCPECETWLDEYKPVHQTSCVACVECSNGDENLQELNDPLQL